MDYLVAVLAGLLIGGLAAWLIASGWVTESTPMEKEIRYAED